METKLTLRLEKDLIDRARAYSRKSGKSISRLVADYFTLLDTSGPTQAQSELSPLVSSLKGSLRGATVSEEDYRRYLEDKYL